MVTSAQTKGVGKNARLTGKHSQSELLEGLDGVQGRVWVALQNLHLVAVLNQRVADQLVEEGLLSHVHTVPLLRPALISRLSQVRVTCSGEVKGTEKSLDSTEPTQNQCYGQR